MGLLRLRGTRPCFEILPKVHIHEHGFIFVLRRGESETLFKRGDGRGKSGFLMFEEFAYPVYDEMILWGKGSF